MVNIYIIRHSETDLNGKGIIQSVNTTSMLDINANGRKQAGIIANYLKNFDIDVVVSSSLKRAVSTANVIAASINKPVEVLKGISEMRGSNVNEILVAEFVKEKFSPPIIYKDAISNEDISVDSGKMIFDALFSNKLEHQNFSYPGGETKAEVKKRFGNTLIDFVKSNPNYKNILVVSHGLTIKSFIAGVSELQDFAFMEHMDIFSFNLSGEKFSFISHEII